jgi:small-conductance mechanosensitive channel
MMRLWLDAWLAPAVAALIAIVAALIVHRVGRAIVFRLVRASELGRAVAEHCDRPAQFALMIVPLSGIFHGAPDELVLIDQVRRVSSLLVVAGFTWLAIGAVRGFAEGIIRLNPLEVADNLKARRIRTQTRLLARATIVVLLVAGAAFMLMTIPGARQVGASLLASAGIAGLVAGIAARSVFGNLIAGIQIALTQPIRVDDVLIVEGEWGRVEQITGAYVVLRILDDRRLIIPLQWFIENPFQNWTRTSAEIIGTVFLWVDYTMPLDPLRAEARRVCEASPHWDGRLCLLQVTDANERAVQLRLLVSAASSGAAWDLRCEVREALIGFVQREYPGSLPQLRAQVEPKPNAGTSDAAGGELPAAQPRAAT